MKNKKKYFLIFFHGNQNQEDGLKKESCCKTKNSEEGAQAQGKKSYCQTQSQERSQGKESCKKGSSKKEKNDKKEIVNRRVREESSLFY